MDQHTRPHPHDDAGLSLIELLVTIVISAAIVGAIIALIGGTSRLMTSAQASTQTMGQMESASTQLMRDVTDARSIIEATPSSLTLEVVRDTACVLTTWTAADDELRVSRSTFTQAPGAPGDPACASTGGERAEVRVVQRLTDDEPFEFFSRESTSEPLALPVSADDVARVTWALTATPAYPADADPRTVASGAAVAQSTGSTGGGASQDARAPLLEAVTPHEGVGQPVLRWADPTPAVTQAWTLFRIAYPEGGTAAGTWEALITLPGSQSTYTDASLPAGYTARYILRATLTDGRTGPTSPQVATGIRPAPVTLTATGQDASIVVSWTAATGATAYDLYRDGALYQQSLTGTSWTDATGRGHSHAYRVVPVNRWERCAVRAARCTEALQTYQVPVGTPDTASLPGGSPTAVRRLSAPSGAWSAPLAVTGLTAANRQPGDTTDPGAQWDSTVDISWTPSAWTGAYSAQAQAATRYALTRGGAAVRAGLTASSTTDTGAARGATHSYVVTASTVAPHALTGLTAAASHLTWPDAPTCAATPGGGGQPATRAATVTVAGPGGQTVTSHRQRIADGTVRHATSSAWTELVHATGYAWRGQAGNAGGLGPWGAACSIVTQRLDPPSVVVGDITTRSASASATAVTPGSWVSAGPSIAGGPGVRSDLDDGTGYSVAAAVTDGHNVVPAVTAFTTRPLPSASCTMAGGGTAPANVTVTSHLTSAAPGVWAQARLGGGSWTTGSATTASAGTWSGYGRATDGRNASGASGCGSRTITNPTVYGWRASPPTICGRVASSGAVRTYVAAQYNATHYASSAYTGATPVYWWVVISGGVGDQIHDARWRIAVVNRATDRSDQIEGGYLCSGVYG